ncbi:MAG TPA: hypothetical protein VFH97_06745 [Gemmatimonadales bacterium]|nr:hypothetical protein [Gemmatimonadales bacterium]
MRLAFSSLSGLILLGTACASGGLRPSYEPFPQARVDTINAAPAAVIQELATAIRTENMRPQWTSPDEGFLETQWFNVVTQESGVADRTQLERIILLRFFADPIEGGKTRVTSEAVQGRTADQSVMGRDREMPVPPGSVGDQILGRVLAAVQQRFGK